MEKLYRLLLWLDSAQAVDYLQSLAEMQVRVRDLIALCDAFHCNAYVDCSGLEAIIPDFSELCGHIRLSGHYSITNPSKIPIHAWDEPGEPLLYVSGLQSVFGEARIVDVFENETRQERGRWDVVLGGARGVPVLFKTLELEALAIKLNGAQGESRGAEVENLRQQLEQERAARSAAEAEAEALRQSRSSAIEAISRLENECHELRVFAEFGRREAEEMRASVNLGGLTSGGLTFPYKTRELEVMCDAVAKFWENHTPDKRQPTQKEIGLWIGQSLGLPRQVSGDAARAAIVMAGAIKRPAGT